MLDEIASLYQDFLDGGEHRVREAVSFDESRLSKILCGPHSIESLQNLRRVLELSNEFLNRLLRALNGSVTANHSTIPFQLSGLKHVAGAAALLFKDRESLDGDAHRQFEEHLRNSITDFEAAFGKDPSSPVDPAWALSPDYVFRIFFECIEVWNTGALTSLKLLDRMVQTGDRKRVKPRVATIPVLGVGNYFSRVLWLEVELHSFGTGFVAPDLGCFGLTELRSSSEQTDFIDSIHRIWFASGLCEHFGCVVRLMNNRIAGQFEEAPCFPGQFSGRSLEAAFLCTLLAAAGFADEGSTFANGAVLPLFADTAVTAQLSLSRNGDPYAATLLPVEGLQHKLLAAKRSGLNTVVVAAESETTEDNSASITLIPAPTIADVMDVILVQNRFLKAFQQHHREGWLKSWNQGTARVAGDTLPGADDNNWGSDDE